ncbi:ion channel [Leptolyngbya iicbica]|uniref:Ion transporter n=2 Tax=Cyanophyceae TaxID=3028117 RepID=A0A4Q7EHG7_9CYAN|nr:ion channel [Leptolyngbya sp. LK]RZM82546.1 ion transporter [Leptolyngbya sp. LK]
MTLKSTIAAYLDDTNRETGGWVTGAIALLTVAAGVLVVLSTYEVSPAWHPLLHLASGAILLLFITEYGLRLWTAERWWRYVFSVYGLVDLVAIVSLVPGVFNLPGLQLLRWLRVLRLARLLSDRAILARITAADTLAVVRIIFTVIGIIFVYAGLIFQVEEHYQPETFSTFFDAAYFAVVTITTVGYGDITPVSDAGRLCTMLMILTGIALIPTQLGDLIRRIIKVSNSVERPCDRCGAVLHDPDALFCKRCGASLMLPPLFQQLSDDEATALAWPQTGREAPPEDSLITASSTDATTAPPPQNSA